MIISKIDRIILLWQEEVENLLKISISLFLGTKTRFSRKISRKKGLFSSIITVFSILTSLQLTAQTQDNTELNLLIEDFIEGQEESSEFEIIDIYENIYTALENPCDINNLNAQELRSLYIISDIDINKIIEHRNIYGPFTDINELQAIDGINNSTLKLLRRLTYVSNSEIKPLAQIQQRTEIITKLRQDFETRRGFTSINRDDPRYRGDRNYLLLRINRRDDQNLSYNLTLEKDAGESFGESSIGFDYISGYLHKKNLSNTLTSLTIGDYSIRLGEGLMLNNGFGFGKSIASVNIKSGGYPIKPYTSTQENLAFRGIATEWQFNSFSMINFLSYRSLDGNLSTDIDNQEIVSSLQTSGLHRTEGELIDKNAVQNLSAGFSLQYQIASNTTVRLNGITHNLSLPLKRSSADYNLYRFNGNQSHGISIDYNTVFEGFHFFGEAAIGHNGATAQSHGIIKSLSPKFDMGIHIRHFDREFQALQSNTFSESRSSENESGQYIGVEFRPTKKWRINAYTDFWQHPWLRFRVDAPSSGNEYLLRAVYNKRRKRTIFVQYRYERKQENSSMNDNIDRVVDFHIQRMRIQLNEKVNSSLELRTRIEGSLYQKEQERLTGWMAYQDILFINSETPVNLAARLMYFDVDDFDARIYAYESDLRYEYSIPFFSGKGLRYYLRASYRTKNRMIIEARLSQTNYLDGRMTISSGNNEIEGDKLTQLKLQLRYLF